MAHEEHQISNPAVTNTTGETSQMLQARHLWTDGWAWWQDLFIAFCCMLYQRLKLIPSSPVNPCEKHWPSVPCTMTCRLCQRVKKRSRCQHPHVAAVWRARRWPSEASHMYNVLPSLSPSFFDLPDTKQSSKSFKSSKQVTALSSGCVRKVRRRCKGTPVSYFNTCFLQTYTLQCKKYWAVAHPEQAQMIRRMMMALAGWTIWNHLSGRQNRSSNVPPRFIGWSPIGCQDAQASLCCITKYVLIFNVISIHLRIYAQIHTYTYVKFDPSNTMYRQAYDWCCCLGHVQPRSTHHHGGLLSACIWCCAVFWMRLPLLSSRPCCSSNHLRHWCCLAGSVCPGRMLFCMLASFCHEWQPGNLRSFDSFSLLYLPQTPMATKTCWLWKARQNKLKTNDARLARLFARDCFRCWW